MTINVSPWALHGEKIVERLKELFSAGGSCAQIAAVLSTDFQTRVTRNAVIGKASRLGLQSTRPPGYEFTSRERNSRAKREPRVVNRLRKSGSANNLRLIQTIESAEVRRIRAADVVPKHITFDELTPSTCHYPFGEGPFTFCGCDAVEGKPYCEPHQLLTHSAHFNIGRERPDQTYILRKRGAGATMLAAVSEEEAA
jgi:hypothetical protein